FESFRCALATHPRPRGKKLRQDCSRSGMFRSIWRFFEMNSFSRVATALVLVSSVLAGSIVGFAQTTDSRQQTQSQTATTQAATTKDTSKTQQTVATLPAGSGKALSTNEDPSMIGKRNINKGIIAGMSGSTEKEVRIGRELSAEVDRQAKFI